MALNKSNGNMYPFITHTWNPIKGICPHGCTYCYMKKIYSRFGIPKKREFHEVRDYHGKDKFIFVGSSTDIFANGAVDSWIIEEVFSVIAKNIFSTYLLQTKNPAAFLNFRKHIPFNVLLCTTIESNREYPHIYGNSPSIADRVKAFAQVDLPKMITIEPILDFDTQEFISLIKLAGAEQVNIGADTGHNNLPEPPKEKIIDLITELEKFTTVVQKKNLRRVIA